MILTSTSDIVRIVTSSTADIHVQASWADITTTAFTPGRTNTVITTATTTTVVASPGASTQRQCKTLLIYNAHASTTNTVTVQLYDGTTSATVYSLDLSAGELLQYDGTQFIVASTGAGITDGDKGDVTVSASGATWTIDDGVVTLAKQADMATASVVYRKTAGTGAPEVNTLATLKTDLGLTGTNSGDQTNISGNAATVTTNANLTGPITSVGNATTIADAELAAIAGLTSAADKFPYFTGSGTAALADLPSTARTFLTTPSSANLAALLSDETGTGANVHATSPTLVTPVLGTPTSVDLINSTNGSGFRAYLGSNQSYTANVQTKMNLNTEDFDNGSYYDNATNYRYTPLVSGKYLIECALYTTGQSGSNTNIIYIKKNGSTVVANQSISAAGVLLTASTIVELNGSTDYIEMFALQSGGTPVAQATYTNMAGLRLL